MVTRILLALAALLGVGQAAAGPPYATDDPDPTDHLKWENYLFVNGTRIGAATTGSAGLDVNHGARPGLQLSATLPMDYVDDHGRRISSGTVELAAKYRLVEQSADGRHPLSLAVFPRVFLPTDSSGSSWHPGLLLPVWLGSHSGPWAWFGGGGLLLQGGDGQRSFGIAGIAVTRDINERLNLGVEVFHRGADRVDAAPWTFVNAGLIWRTASHWSLLASAGPAIQNQGSEGRAQFYLSVRAEY